MRSHEIQAADFPRRYFIIRRSSNNSQPRLKSDVLYRLCTMQASLVPVGHLSKQTVLQAQSRADSRVGKVLDMWSHFLAGFEIWAAWATHTALYLARSDVVVYNEGWL